MSQVIAAVQEKGGAGKTTTLLTIGLKMLSDGAKIAVIDTDQRKNMARFCEKYKIDFVFVDNEDKIKPTIDAIKSRNYDVIFIDTEGYKSVLTNYVIANSDLIIIPSNAEESNVICAARTFQTVKTVCDNFNKKISSYLLLTDVDHQTKITAAMQKSIKDSGLPLFSTKVGHATGFKEMFTRGEIPAAGAARKHQEALMCELQMKNILKFYGENKCQN